MLARLIKEYKTYASSDNILIYQMGKVGSTSLEKTIPGSIHIHTLFFLWPTHKPPSVRRNNLKKKMAGWLYDKLRISAIKSRKKIKIISLVRDPYSRNISDFFQGFSYWVYKYTLKVATDARSVSDPTFVYNVFDKMYDHNYGIDWFDTEFKRMTGIDVYDFNFDKSKGIQKIISGKYEILIIKLEKMDSVWNEIEEFAGIKMNMTNANFGSNKWYAPIYKTFSSNYVPTDEYLDKLYNSKFSKHFYSNEEINQFKSKALKNKDLSRINTL